MTNATRPKSPRRKSVSAGKRDGAAHKRTGGTRDGNKGLGGPVAEDQGAAGLPCDVREGGYVGAGAGGYSFDISSVAGERPYCPRAVQVTYCGAAVAVGIALIAMFGHLFRLRELTTFGNAVPMGGVSILFLIALSYVAVRSVREDHFGWWALPLAALAWAGVFARLTGVGLWKIHPLVNIASFPAMACYLLIAWGLLFRHPPVARAVPLAGAIFIACVSAMAHWPGLVERTMIGSHYMSLPSAFAIMALAGGILIDMGAKPFRGWREMFPV